MQAKSTRVQRLRLVASSEHPGSLSAVRDQKSRRNPELAFTDRSDPLADMLAFPLLTESIGQRFWRMVYRQAPDKCWPFLGSTRRGYGRFKLVSYVVVTASRAAYALGHGVTPGELHVLHRCDNPPCCNPDHLFLGTNADNVADKVAKGRVPIMDQKGEKNGAAKLSQAQVDEIRVLIGNGLTNVAIAAQYGVTHQLISRIRRGRSWGEGEMQPRYASLRRAR